MIPYLLLLTAVWAECIFILPDGNAVDLNELQLKEQPDYQVFSLSGFLYMANICGESSMTCNGDTSGVAGQWIGFSDCIAVLARKSSGKRESSEPTADYIDSQDKTRGVVVSYYNGDICFNLGFTERKVLYELLCDENVDIELMDVIEFPTCVYTFKFRTKHGCIVEETDKDVTIPQIDIIAPVASATRPAKTSWTRTLLILLVISVLVYVVLRYLASKNSSESLPLSRNDKVDLIKSLPHLLISSICRSIYKCRGLLEVYIFRTKDYQDLI